MNILTFSIGVSLLMALTMSGCQSTGPPEFSGTIDNEPASRLTSLENSLAPLRDHFNARAARPRFLAILSPT